MKSTIRISGEYIDLTHPKIMGIVNLTSDSFYDGGSSESVKDALAKVERLLNEGADWIDLGAQSTRPGSHQMGAEEEWKRLGPILQEVTSSFPKATLSIDTYHSSVAEKAINAGAHIINDISAGQLDENMFAVAGALKVPYVLTHMQGRPETMQANPTYNNVLLEVTAELAHSANKLIDCGVDDILIDPGFGFGKSTEHNFTLLRNLEYLKSIGHPLLIGLSRKGMIWKTLNTSPQEALNGTTALHMAALMNGASVLRVHDVKAAAEVRTLWTNLQPTNTAND